MIVGHHIRMSDLDTRSNGDLSDPKIEEPNEQKRVFLILSFYGEWNSPRTTSE